MPAARAGEAAAGGVIQISRRRRRASKEINLETLAQKASEMESLPAKTIKVKTKLNVSSPGETNNFNHKLTAFEMLAVG